MGIDHRLRVEPRRRRASAERVLVHDQEQQRRDQRVDHVGHRDGAELAAVDAALDQLAEHAVARHRHLVDVELGDLGKVAHLRHHQLEDARGPRLANAFPPEPQDERQQVRGRALEGADDLDALGDLVDHVVPDHFLQQLFLARVVEVERALRNAGAGRDFLGACCREALLDEQVEGCIEQFLGTCFLAALAGRDGGGRGHRDQ